MMSRWFFGGGAGGGTQGPPGIVFRGTYDPLADYGVDDAVFYPNDGLTYFAIQGNTGIAPGNATYWSVLAGENSYDAEGASIGWEVFPATLKAADNLTLVAGTEYFFFFRAKSVAAVNSVKFSIGTALTGVTTPVGLLGIYDVDTSRQPTTLLASGSQANFGISGFQSMYKTSSIGNTITLSSAWTPTAVGKLYCAGLLFTGTGGTGPLVRGRTVSDGAVEAGYSLVAGTAFMSKYHTTGLVALVASGTPAETAANLVTGSSAVQPGALFLP